MYEEVETRRAQGRAFKKDEGVVAQLCGWIGGQELDIGLSLDVPLQLGRLGVGKPLQQAWKLSWMELNSQAQTTSRGAATSKP